MRLRHIRPYRPCWGDPTDWDLWVAMGAHRVARRLGAVMSYAERERFIEEYTAHDKLDTRQIILRTGRYRLAAVGGKLRVVPR